MGLCEKPEGEPSCTDEYARCISTGSGFVDVCAPQCNPLSEECGTDRSCLWDEHAGRFSCALAAYDTRDKGEECTGCEHCCDAGLYCAAAKDVPSCSGEHCCNAWCDTETGVGCEAGQSCVGFWPNGASPPGHANLGQCKI